MRQGIECEIDISVPSSLILIEKLCQIKIKQVDLAKSR